MKNKLNNKAIEKIKSLNIKDSDLWLNEANFGFLNIKDFCEKLSKDNKVLEVGCGSGILLYILSNKYKNLNSYIN